MKIIERDSCYSVKGTLISFVERVKINEETGEEIYDPELGQENDIRLYNKYREIYSLLYPEEIKKIRERLGVTQLELSQILGFSDKSVARFENGSLQDRAQDNLIKIVGRNQEEF